MATIHKSAYDKEMTEELKIILMKQRKEIRPYEEEEEEEETRWCETTCVKSTPMIMMVIIKDGIMSANSKHRSNREPGNDSKGI